jgi:hypothetical protein
MVKIAEVTKMKKDYKELWKILEKNLELEVSLCYRQMQNQKKAEDYIGLFISREELNTVQWVLEQMEHIEETGEVL